MRIASASSVQEMATSTETSRVAGCSRRPIRTRTIGGLVRTFVACKLFAEPLESRGESGLIGLPVATVAVLARAVGHGFPHSRISVRGMSAPEAERTNAVFRVQFRLYCPMPD